MVSRRVLIATVGCVAGAGCLAGGDGTPTPSIGPPNGDIGVSSPAFDHGSSIPERYTGDGADVSPPLAIDGIPGAAEELALIVDDPDAPEPPFTHWLCWAIPPDVGEIPAAVPAADRVPALGGAVQGENDFGELGYRGPLPPADDGPHRYRFTVFALESGLALDPGARRGAVDDARAGRVLERGRLVGRYDR